MPGGLTSVALAAGREDPYTAAEVAILHLTSLAAMIGLPLTVVLAYGAIAFFIRSYFEALHQLWLERKPLEMWLGRISLAAFLWQLFD